MLPTRNGHRTLPDQDSETRSSSLKYGVENSEPNGFCSRAS